MQRRLGCIIELAKITLITMEICKKLGVKDGDNVASRRCPGWFLKKAERLARNRTKIG
jgi:hypothetical protein